MESGFPTKPLPSTEMKRALGTLNYWPEKLLNQSVEKKTWLLIGDYINLQICSYSIIEVCLLRNRRDVHWKINWSLRVKPAGK